MSESEKLVAQNCESSWDFLESRTTLLPRHDLLRTVVALAYSVPGEIVEFGVANGNSTRVIRRTANELERRYSSDSRKRIFACDSFEGLPEQYENAAVGAFACEPPNIRGVEIVKGYFEDTLNSELAKKVGKVSFASLDADLYSSTLCALNWLTPLLSSGSLLLFDEFIGEDESEKRAFEDWSEQTGTKSVLIGYFLRKPSAWGSSPDYRALYQVVDDTVLSKNREKQPIKRKVTKFLKEQNPALYRKIRSMYDK